MLPRLALISNSSCEKEIHYVYSCFALYLSSKNPEKILLNCAFLLQRKQFPPAVKFSPVNSRLFLINLPHTGSLNLLILKTLFATSILYTYSATEEDITQLY